MKDSVDCPIGVIDETGTVIACSELSRIGEVLDSSVGEKVFAGSEVTIVNDMAFKSFGSPIRPEYALFVDGSDENAKRFVGVLAVAVSNIMAKVNNFFFMSVLIMDSYSVSVK
jgi:carbohydrate diacid regulator